MLPSVEVGGAQRTFNHAVSFSNGSDSITVWLSNMAISCDAVTKLVRLRDEEERVRLVFARGYAEDTPGPWDVRWVSLLKPKRAHVHVFPDRGSRVKVERVGGDKALDATLKLDATIDTANTKKLTISGRLQTRGCGALTFENDGPPRPQTKLNAKSGKENILFRGARLHGSAEAPDKLELSTSALPEDCATFPWSAEDMRITISIVDGSPADATIDGDRFRSFVSPRIDWSKGAFSLGKPSGDSVPIELSFDYYALRVSGTVEAHVCK